MPADDRQKRTSCQQMVRQEEGDCRRAHRLLACHKHGHRRYKGKRKLDQLLNS